MFAELYQNGYSRRVARAHDGRYWMILYMVNTTHHKSSTEMTHLAMAVEVEGALPTPVHLIEFLQSDLIVDQVTIDKLTKGEPL